MFLSLIYVLGVPNCFSFLSYVSPEGHKDVGPSSGRGHKLSYPWSKTVLPLEQHLWAVYTALLPLEMLLKEPFILFKEALPPG